MLAHRLLKMSLLLRQSGKLLPRGVKIVYHSIYARRARSRSGIARLERYGREKHGQAVCVSICDRLRLAQQLPDKIRSELRELRRRLS